MSKLSLQGEFNYLKVCYDNVSEKKEQLEQQNKRMTTALQLLKSEHTVRGEDAWNVIERALEV
jgi:hypothetical protein